MISSMTALPYLFGLGELRKEVTEQYPDPISSRTEDDLPPKTKGTLINNIDRCTGCGDCARVCPSRCIRVETEPTDDLLKEWVSVFDIDISKCIYCGLCVEACIPQSLVHSKKFAVSALSQNELVVSYGRGRLTLEQRQKWETMRRIKQGD
jgi:formate hydrogenlyase subunit 6/NADH:ubiquinone oxidoreductase subunit I